MGFPIKNDHFGVFWRYPHLRKHPMTWFWFVSWPNPAISPCVLLASWQNLTSWDFWRLSGPPHRLSHRKGGPCTSVLPGLSLLYHLYLIDYRDKLPRDGHRSTLWICSLTAKLNTWANAQWAFRCPSDHLDQLPYMLPCYVMPCHPNVIFHRSSLRLTPAATWLWIHERKKE